MVPSILLQRDVITLFLCPEASDGNGTDDSPRAKRDGHDEYNLGGARMSMFDCSGQTADKLHRHAGDVHKVPPDHCVRARRLAGIEDGLIVLTTDMGAATAT